jgi:hypothetical protein
MPQAGFRNDKPLMYIQIPAVVINAGFTLSPPPEATYALIQPEAQAVRWRDDGTAATATVGYPLAVGAELRYTGNLTKFNVISQTAGAILNVVFYGG